MLIKKVIIFFILISALALSGCSSLQIQNPFTTDPLTGGQNATTSILLGCPIPSGMQRYPSHGYISTGADGRRVGLETYRGNVDGSYAATTMFNGLESSGWQLKMQNRKGDRAVYVFQKGNTFVAIVFHRQGILTIMEIWQGSNLHEGAGQNQLEDDNPLPSIAGEEYGPLDENTVPTQNKTETWGNKNLEEKDL